ncbi:uncharacterized protein RJT21DRAFT_139164 [Scheffersomyces amazonensis]|uniref:uncharacterized protein n=1 Tax=Scheffersomyces amazonensis TaxID=1078765 RepID=UPI00315D9983
MVSGLQELEEEIPISVSEDIPNTFTVNVYKRDLEFIKNDDIPFGADLSLGEDFSIQGMTVNNMALARDYSEEELVSNAVYIFLLLVFSTVVLGALLFGIREYYLSIRYKPNSATSDKVRKSNWNNAIVSSKIAKDQKDHKDQEFSSHSQYQMKKVTDKISNDEEWNEISINEERSRISSGIVSQLSENQQLPVSEYSQYKENPVTVTNSTEGGLLTNDSLDVQVVKTIKVFHDDNVNSPEFSEHSITKFLQSEFKEVEGLKQYKKGNKYNYKQLNEIRDTVISSIFSTLTSEEKESHCIRMTSVLRYSLPIPKTSFTSVYFADRVIGEIRTNLLGTNSENLDNTTKSIEILKLLSIGVSYNLFDNPNYFIPIFNDFITDIIDTNAVFELLKDLNSNSQSLLIEMILIYCWSHYNFKKSNNSSIKIQFQAWKLQEPVIQPRYNIFRFLCNVLLGLSIIDYIPTSVRMEDELKTFVLLREAVKGSLCNEYISMVPMFAQAVDVTQLSDIKYLFYELLKLLVSKHVKCCMDDYLQQNDIDLKAILQHGFWNKHQNKVSRKTREIYQILLDNGYSQVRSWRKEVGDGQIYVPSAPLQLEMPEPIDSAAFYTARAPRPVTPGSWNIEPSKRGSNSEGNIAANNAIANATANSGSPIVIPSLRNATFQHHRIQSQRIHQNSSNNESAH